MAFQVEMLIADLAATGSDGDALVRPSYNAGIVEAIDLAMVDESMSDDFLGADVHLRDLLRRRVNRAKTMAKGWAVGVTKYGGRGGAAAGEGPELVQASRPGGPCPGRAPRTWVVRRARPRRWGKGKTHVRQCASFPPTPKLHA